MVLLPWVMVSFFALGYMALMAEPWLRINKTALALLLAVVCWSIYFVFADVTINQCVQELNFCLSSISQILFFLLGAMAMVELIDSHRGFDTFVKYISSRSKCKVMCIICVLSFFLSSILDNLTTTILMVSILRKLIPKKSDRFLHVCMVVVAANAGGAWTPIGDITTTMLWIGGQITTYNVIKAIFLPSLLSILVPLMLSCRQMKGELAMPSITDVKKGEPGAMAILLLGMVLFLFVPIFKAVTGLPPFMGIIVSLGIMWVVTDLMHHRHDGRKHLRVPHVLTRVDVSSVLFFLGILLSVGALEAFGILKTFSYWLSAHLGSKLSIAASIGIISSIVDNVPLVAAAMGMYPDLQVNDPLWLMVAYTAGTGGSLLIMGSSSGVAAMGMEGVGFLKYFLKMTLAVLVGYFLGMVPLYYVFRGAL